MTHRYELIVFDWDGTLMDSAGAIVQAIAAACRDLGLPEPPESRSRHVIGLGLQEALSHAIPELAAADYPQLVDRYRHHYLRADHELTLFPGMFDLVGALADEGRLLAVATGKSRKGLDRALTHSGLEKFFHATRCADECFSKPHPEMLHQLMEELGVTRDRTLMIGDTTHDLSMARNAGVDALGVGFGAHPREELALAAPLAVLDTPQALVKWLRTQA